MKIEFSQADLQPLVALAVAEAVKQLASDDGKLPTDRVAYLESEAARMMGVARHTLRDARLRGEISASKVGKKIVYSRADLLAFLERQRIGGERN